MAGSKGVYLLVLLGFICFGAQQTHARRHWDRRFCRDEQSYANCNFWNKMGLCKVKAYFEHLAKACPKTCNLCTWGLEKSVDDCKDKDLVNHCEFLRDNGACQTHANIMADRCPRTCKLCDAAPKCSKAKCKFNEICVLDGDRNAQCICPRYCVNKEEYRKLGRVCGSDGKTYKDFCHMQHHACREDNNVTVTKYGYCEGDEPCEDAKVESEHGMCKAWKEAGFCEKKIYDFQMRKYCKRTCGHCDKGKAAASKLRGECDDKKKSPYGCCWDLSFRRNPKSPKQCPSCRDHYKFCGKFIDQCNTVKNMAIMKEKCPVTCGFCTPEKKRVVELIVVGSEFTESHKHLTN
eukprot:TCONS_00057266-protein